MAQRIAINGFGRIGRAFLRAVFADAQKAKEINVVAINLGPTTNNTAHLFKYDSVMGTFPGTVEERNNTLIVNGHEIALLAQADAATLPWKQLNIDFVVEASGAYTDKQDALKHCASGAKKVLITAPSKNPDVTIIPGVNDEAYNASKHTIISLGSCTTNCFAPIVKIINDTFGIEQGSMSTTHAYTMDQRLLDGAHKDPRRARAAAINLIPTTTGASRVITTIFPELEGKLCASALRVPVANVSFLEFVFVAKKPISIPEINKAFQEASITTMKHIISYETEPLVSSDFIGNTHSCIIDSALTSSVGKLGKVAAWYDNEYGYSCRLKDFLLRSPIK